MSGEDTEINAKVKSLTQLEIWRKEWREAPNPAWLNTLSLEARSALEKDFAAKKSEADIQSLHVQANNIRTNVLRESRSLTTPTPTLTDWAKKAKSLTIAILRSNIEVTEAEVELFDEAIQMLNAGIAEPLRKKISVQNEVNVVYTRFGNSWGQRIYGETEWNRHEKESKQKIQILEVAKLWHLS